MKKKIKSFIIIVGIMVIFLLNGKPLYSLSNPDHVLEIIKIAYMNGYIQAMELSYEDAKDLKQNKELLKLAVKREADRYIKHVAKLNNQADRYAQRYN